MPEFKWFLLNEQKAYFGKQVGDVLSSVHDIEEDMENVGTRYLLKVGENIVNRIRRILHSSWGPQEEKYLKQLQKVAVALMKTIEEKGDIKDTLKSAGQELASISSKLGVKVSQITAPPEEQEGEPIDDEDFEAAETPETPPQSEQPPPGTPPPPAGMPQAQQSMLPPAGVPGGPLPPMGGGMAGF